MMWIQADYELSAVHLQGSAGPHNVMLLKCGLVKSAAQTVCEA